MQQGIVSIPVWLIMLAGGASFAWIIPLIGFAMNWRSIQDRLANIDKEHAKDAALIDQKSTKAHDRLDAMWRELASHEKEIAILKNYRHRVDRAGVVDEIAEEVTQRIRMSPPAIKGEPK